ncbi:MAG: hypothetical protein JKY53_01070 [Flavobacteriales bacterium]|nr:hypothetical protein [Flavobacteriales bacterium]
MKGFLTTIIAITLFLLGNSVVAQSKTGIEEAREAFENQRYIDAIGLTEELLGRIENNPIELSRVLRLLGDVYTDINQFEVAQETYFEALKAVEEGHASLEKADVLLSIGTLYMTLGEFDKAIGYLYRSKQSFQEANQEQNKQFIHCLQMIGIVYGNISELDSSLYYFNNSIAIARLRNDKTLTGGLLNNIGAIYSKQGKLDSAIQKYSLALQMFQEIQNDIGIGVSISNVAFISQKKGDYAKSIKEYLKSIKYFSEVKAIPYLSNNYDNLSYSYELNSQQDSALIFYKKHIELQDSLGRKEMLERIANLEIKYEIEKKNQQLALLSKENKIIEQEKAIKDKQFNLVLISAISLLILGGLVIISLRVSLKNNKLKQVVLKSDKQNLEHDLSYKTKELENFAMHLVKRNDVLVEVKSSLKNMRRYSSIENTQMLTELTLKINNITKSSNELKNLQARLEEVNQLFFSRLEKKYPQLTHNERQLCGLIKMGLSSKEVALLNDVTERAIITARHRLRKKIEISTAQNLVDFLNTIELG